MASDDSQFAAFREIVNSLEPVQVELLIEMALALAMPSVSLVSPHSDIVVQDFSTNISNRLKAYHAISEETFKKKTFEYAFKSASRAAGRTAHIVSSETNPGADVIVDGVKFSLKTEAAKTIRADRITISKLMEARWIRECRTGEDFAEGIKARVVPHLQRYERVLTLRAFQLKGRKIRYDLVEIPVTVLLSMAAVTASSFSPRTKNGSTSADIATGGGGTFQLRLDGSVEKVTVTGLDVRECVAHASWTIPVMVGEAEPELS